MHAAKPHPNNSSLRSQLLSNEVGNIDVRYETPINRSSFPQPGFAPRQQQQSPVGHPQQQFHPPPNVVYAPQQPQQQQSYSQPAPRSRRSSIVSNHSNFNMFRKKKKGGAAGGGGDDDDDDDDGKDVVVDASVSMMSFDDLSSMRDRGRYGMQQQNFDTAPIIPTIQTLGTKPGQTVSNTHYRKQMTAMKKYAFTQVGKLSKGDPRAMSLQTTGNNPYLEAPDSRSNSFNSQQFTRRPPPSVQGPGSRANSLTPHPLQSHSNPRAYSLTTNPYQQQKMQQISHHPQQRMMGPGPPRGQPRPQQQQNFPPGQAPINAHRLSVPNIPSPLSINTPAVSGPQQRPLQQQSQFPPQQGGPIVNHQQQQPQAAPVVPAGLTAPAPSPGQSYGYQQQSEGSARQQHQYPQPAQNGTAFTRTLQGQVPVTRLNSPAPQQDGYTPYAEHPSYAKTPSSESLTQRSTNAVQEPGFEREEHSHSSLDPKILTGGNQDNDHHFLAEKTITPGDGSSSSFNDTSLPNGESTPSPQSEAQPFTTTDLEATPSKIPRSKALPRLSVLSIRDESGDDVDLQKQRILEPVDEGSTARSYTRSSTPPGESYSQSPERSSAKRPMSSRVSPHKHSKNAVSISSMSEYSAVSDNQYGDNDNSKKLYQLSQASNTNNDVFVTASQFSFMDHQKRASVASSVTDPDATPKLLRQSVDTESLKSSNSLKGFFKGMSFSKKKKGVDDVPESASKQIPMKEPELLSDSTIESSIESKPVTLAESFVPQQRPKLGLTVDQLGIMEDKSSIMRELDAVSRELAASIQREIGIGGPTAVGRESLSESLEVTQLLQQLNAERKKRYIAEEHVLLLESGAKPSALELSYENDRLKSELFIKEELINKQISEIESLKSEVPHIQQQLEKLRIKTKQLETQVVPTLKNEVEILKAENKNVSILREKVKVLKNEKNQLASGKAFSFAHEDLDFQPPMPSPSSKRLASFNLISVTSSE